MRGRGRLSKANFEFETKHPIRLSSKHPASRLMLLKCHLDNYNQGVESMRHGLQQKFWILGLRNALRNIKNWWISYRKYNAVVQAPITADLQRERVKRVDFPFTQKSFHGVFLDFSINLSLLWQISPSISCSTHFSSLICFCDRVARTFMGICSQY